MSQQRSPAREPSRWRARGGGGGGMTLLFSAAGHRCVMWRAASPRPVVRARVRIVGERGAAQGRAHTEHWHKGVVFIVCAR